MTRRVLIVLASDARRGAEIEGSQLAARLSAAGDAARVVALQATDGQHLEVPTLGRSPISLPALRSLRTLARQHDVVIAYGSTTLPACALALVGTNVRFIYRSIGDPARWVRGALHRWRTGLLFRRAAHVVALWPAAAESIRRLYGVPAERVSVVPNARPVPTTGDRSREEARAALGIEGDGLVVAWAGALSAEKRPDLAVESVALIEGAVLVIAGDGSCRPQVEDACARLLPGRHRLLGVRDSLSPLWAAADVVLLTSSTEGLPGVLIESAMEGVPAVAADVGAVAELVVDGAAGRLVPADDGPGAFAAALIEVADRRAEFGAAAQQHAVEGFSWDVTLPRWMEAIDAVVPRSAR